MPIATTELQMREAAKEMIDRNKRLIEKYEGKFESELITLLSENTRILNAVFLLQGVTQSGKIEWKGGAFRPDMSRYSYLPKHAEQ
jgi:hypothetical protein